MSNFPEDLFFRSSERPRIDGRKSASIRRTDTKVSGKVFYQKKRTKKFFPLLIKPLQPWWTTSLTIAICNMVKGKATMFYLNRCKISLLWLSMAEDTNFCFFRSFIFILPKSERRNLIHSENALIDIKIYWKCIEVCQRFFELFLEAYRKQDSMVGGLLYAYGVRSYASYKLAAFCKHRKYTFVRFFFVALWDRRMILIFFFIVAVVTYDLIIWFVLDQCQLSDPHCNI